MQFITPVHPGEILLDEFLKPMGISQYRLAKSIKVPARRINEIIKGTRAMTADTALRLELFFEVSSLFWLGIQKDYELAVAKLELEEQLIKDVVPWRNLAFA